MNADKVYKYALAIDDWVSINMPMNPEPLCVQLQNNIPYLWARVNGNNPIKPYRFRVAGTGHSLENAGRYIGTFQLDDGALIFHVFMEGSLNDT